jgi:MFS family permease
MMNVLVQSHVADELRGRVMAIYSLSMVGMLPVGSLLIGGLAEGVGEPIAVAFGAIVALAFAIFLFLRIPRIRTLE